MQIKKEEMKLSLLQAGEDEFFEKGYDKASIRSLVKRAHTTIGNFYNYFESKESMYKELVGDINIQMTDLINNHGEFESVDQLQKLEAFDSKDIVLKFLPPIDRRFALLMTGSNTTPYSHARIDLQNLLANHFQDHIMDYAPNYEHKEIGSMIAHQLIEGLVEIGRSDFDKKKAEELTIEQILFIAVGVIGLLGGGK